jgi:hypothetical protein
MSGTLDRLFRFLSPPLKNADFLQILSLVLVMPYVDRVINEVRFPVSSRSATC